VELPEPREDAASAQKRLWAAHTMHTAHNTPIPTPNYLKENDPDTTLTTSRTIYDRDEDLLFAFLFACIEKTIRSGGGRFPLVMTTMITNPEEIPLALLQIDLAIVWTCMYHQWADIMKELRLNGFAVV
jgi:hypothetical protein